MKLTLDQKANVLARMCGQGQFSRAAYELMKTRNPSEREVIVLRMKLMAEDEETFRRCVERLESGGDLFLT